MGQQQLLLLVLGIVLVGLAVAAGIQAFGENSKKSNADALVSDASRIASDMQAWVSKPSAYGGGRGDFSSIAMSQFGYTTSGGIYENNNGRFAITSISSDEAILTGCSVKAYDGSYNKVEAIVTGTGKDEVEVNLSSVQSDCSPASAE